MHFIIYYKNFVVIFIEQLFYFYFLDFKIKKNKTFAKKKFDTFSAKCWHLWKMMQKKKKSTIYSPMTDKIDQQKYYWHF